MSWKSIALTLVLASPLLAQTPPGEAAPAEILLAQQSVPARRVGLLQQTRTAIVQDMAKRLLIPASQLRIANIEGATFNGCMDIAPQDAACTMIAQFGWRVTVQGDSHRWTYHVLQNQTFKLNGMVSVPRSVTQAALQDTARRSGLPVSQLQVNWVEQKTWNDGCLGMPLEGKACTAAVVPGWQVTIAHAEQRWVYHTDSARTVQLNSSVKPRGQR